MTDGDDADGTIEMVTSSGQRTALCDSPLGSGSKACGLVLSAHACGKEVCS